LKAKLLTALQRCYETIDLERCLKREHELAEEHLLRSQKLESLGVLAGGIAHNFNNILTAIIGNTSLAMMRLPDDSPATKFLKSIEASATRAAEIAKQMLDYSGNGFMRVSLINLNELLGNMQSALEMAVPNTISKRFIPLASSFSTKGDAGQLRQVVMSLVINAVEAIGDSNGTIGITSGSAAFDRAYFDSCCFENTNSEGIYVYLDVSDTGCGMDKETIDKLFDPFFSTKFTGRGLGMAAVLGIVRWHKGAIHIESAPGAGSTFRILLPVSTETGAILTGGEHA
jgi:signal transduction histidine kinase